MLKGTAVFGSVLIVTACTAQRSENFQHLQTLRFAERIAFATGIPIKDRLALYDEVYFASGHPREKSLAEAFENAGELGFRLVVERLTSRDSFDRYTSVLYAIDRGGFDLCAAKPHAELRSAALQSGMEDHWLSMIDLGPCELNDPDWQPTAQAYQP